VLVQEAARLADQGKKEEAKGMLGKAAAGLAAAPSSPAVRAEMDHANRYRNSLDTMGDMSSEPAKGARRRSSIARTRRSSNGREWKEAGG